MAYGTFSADVRAKKPMVGTFMKLTDVGVVEALAGSGLDFVCLDGEHAPFDRARLDACLAVARAAAFPAFVRVPAARAEYVLQALDLGAAGLVIPHVDSGAMAAEMGRLSRFGKNGRGFAGSTRGSDFGTGGMPGVLSRGGDPIVLVQIEEPEGVDEAEAIAAAPGIDGVFLGPADLAVGYGHTSIKNDDVAAAYATVGAAVAKSGGAYATFAPTVAAGEELAQHGVTLLFVGSDFGFLTAAAKAAASDFKG